MNHEQGRIATSHATNDYALADSLYQRGNAFAYSGKYAEAACCYCEVLSLVPTHALANNNLGVMYFELGQIHDAIACYQRAVSLQLNYPDAHYNLANAHKALRQFDTAIQCYLNAIQQRPDFDSAHNNLAICLMESGQLNAAIEHFQIALRLRPEFAEAHTGIGLAYSHLGEYDAAIASFNQALLLNPRSAEAHYNRGLVDLIRGEFSTGWDDYEWRWQLPGVVRRFTKIPLWYGESLVGKTLLLHSEQGLGDTIQFIRFAKAIKQRFEGRVIVECPSNCVRLLCSCEGIDRIYARDTPIDERIDFQCPLMSVAQYCVESVASIPSNTPYLCVDTLPPPDVTQTLESFRGTRIGFAWQGSPGYRWDHWRSFSIQWIQKIAEQLPSIHWFSLQKGFGSEQQKNSSWNAIDLGRLLDNGSDAFIETAATLRELDLVITVDSALAHLAGALAVPVWVVLPRSADWRWHITSNTTSPWYPSMRLYRQERLGDWAPVFDRVARDLALQNFG